MISVGSAIDGLVVVSVLAGVSATVRAVRSAGPPVGSPVARRLRDSPGFWLAAVVAAVYVNQVLFTVYVLRVHGGDPWFIARYLPAGWFDLADGPAMRAVAAVVPAPDLLAPSVLRVQAVLELPFVVLAYLCAARWLDPVRARALCRPVVLGAACVAYTVVFSLVEWGLPNPYTTQDIVLRAVSGVVTPLAILWWRRRTPGPGTAPGPPAPGSAFEVLLAVLSVAALGVLVLLVYDTALLYNLGHVPALFPVAVLALAVLTGARLAAARRAPRTPGPAVDTVGTGLAWFMTLFFVPALPVRYALDLGTTWLTVAAAAVVAGAAATLTVLEVRARLGQRSVVGWLVRLTAAGVAGTAAASAALLPPPTYPEVRILLAAGLFLSAALAISKLGDVLFLETQRH